MKPAKAHRSRRARARPLLHPAAGLLGEFIHLHLGLGQALARETGHSLARLKLVHELLHAGREGVGVCELARQLGVTPALITRQVQELAAEGWVHRREVATDGRRRLVLLSARGRREGARLHERAHEFEAELLEGVTGDDLAAAARVLGTIRARVESRLREPRRSPDSLPPKTAM